MKIVLLTTNLARGGAECQVAQLALSLRARWDVRVISLLPPTAFRRDLEAAGVPVFSLGMRPGKANAIGLVRLARLLRDIRPQVLHSHLFHANVLARVLRLVLPVPVVISTSHSVVETSQQSADPRGRERIYRWTGLLADATVAVCQAGAQQLARANAVSPGRLHVIPNGVDTGRFQPLPAMRTMARRQLGLGDGFVWLAAGRLMWKKDYPTLLRAFAAVPGSVLLIAGSGEQEPELQALAGNLGVNARFLGARDDIPNLLNACDAFALSSVIEGLPLVLIEAAACGVPMVATETGGVPEIVKDGKTGYLVPPSSPDALASAMKRLMDLPPETRQRMGEAARAHAVERYSWDKVAAQWEALYAGLIAEARKSSGYDGS